MIYYYEVRAYTKTGTYSDYVHAATSVEALRKLRAHIAAKVLKRTGAKVREWYVERVH